MISGRAYRYEYDSRLGRERYGGAVEPAQSGKYVLYDLDDEVTENMIDMFVKGYTFADIRRYLSQHGVGCCAATIRKYMKDNRIERYMY